MSQNRTKQAEPFGIGSAITRKEFLKRASATGAIAGAGLLGRVGRARAAEPIKIAFLLDLTGIWAEFGTPQGHAVQLTCDEINAAGGIMGRPIEPIIIDAQSDTDKYVSLTRLVIGRDKPDAIFGGGGSQNREAMRPIAHAAEIPYFYCTAYEGGVADSWTFCTGLVPEQGFATLVPYMIEKYGPRVYDLAADYTWGQLSTLWLKKYVSEKGGEVVGTEAIPLNVSDFSTSLTRLQQAKPDWMYSSLTGREQAAFFNQRAAQGVTIPMADFVITVAQAGNHKRMQPPVLSGLHETCNYVEELPGAANAEFVKKFRAKYPDEVFINQEAQNNYFTIYLYKKAVELAGSTKPIEVVKALETGIAFDAPEGPIKINPATHHASHTVHLIRVAQDHKLEFLTKWENIEPFWLTTIGVDLTKKPDNKQYSPLQSQ